MTPIRRIRSRKLGAFSQRETVGCEHRSRPVSGSRPQASLNPGSPPAGRGRRRLHSRRRWRRCEHAGCREADGMTRSASRSSGITRASRSAMPSRRSAWAKSITPPSDVIRPPSKAALTFFRATGGRSKGRGISSSIKIHCSLIAVRLLIRSTMTHIQFRPTPPGHPRRRNNRMA